MKKKKKEKQAQLPFRLNILFFTVFLLFSILILQLGVVQILNGESFQEEIDQTIQDVTKVPVPRGKLFDRNHQVVVDNEPLYAITYTPPKGVQEEDKLDVAKKLSKFITMDIIDDDGNVTGLSLRNKQEYRYLMDSEKAESRLTEEEREDIEEIGEQYTEVLERIPDEEIEALTDEELQIIAIKKELDKAYSLTPQIVKSEGITIEEYARVAEHLDQLDGINVTTDWDRSYPNESSFHAFLGSITNQNQGILAEKEQYYLTRGYNRNDRVGRSGLEEQYEEILRGRKEQIQYVTNKNGKVIDSNVLVEGERGKDLVLTIDLEYQKRLDEIVQRELETTINKHPKANQYLEDALAVVMNPKTGEILAISGQYYNRETEEFENAALRSVYDAHIPGSVVKGATVLAGYDSGVIVPNQIFNDHQLTFAGPIKKSSVGNVAMGPVNDLDALERSSNVYMFRIVMGMGGEFNYRKNMKLGFKSNTLQNLQNYFRQFGLGTNTGIDFPYEGIGFPGENPNPGNLLDFGIGQYSTYTTLQLAQYVSTIANDGYRTRPHFVKEIREPTPYTDELGPVYRSINTEVLNKIEMDDMYIKRVQEGFRRAFQGDRGTGSRYFADREYNPAGKTGTAENNVWGTDTVNLALIGYAPFDDPEVAFAVMVPNVGTGITGRHPINHSIGQGILDTYFELKEEREGNTTQEREDQEDE